MGFGSTAKKVQKLADTAEQLYSKLTELREQVVEVRDQLDATNERVERLERRAAEQRALLEAVADQQGVDPEEALADADFPDEPSGAEEATTDAEEAAAGGDEATAGGDT